MPRACQITSICFNMVFDICFNPCFNDCFSCLQQLSTTFRCQILDLGKGQQTNTSAMTPPFCFRFRQKMNVFFRNGLRKDPCQDKDSEMDSETSSDNIYCFNIAHARLLLQGPPGIGIGSCLTLAGHLFFWHIFWCPCFTQSCNFGWKMYPKWDPKWSVLGPNF